MASGPSDNLMRDHATALLADGSALRVIVFALIRNVVGLYQIDRTLYWVDWVNAYNVPYATTPIGLR